MQLQVGISSLTYHKEKYRYVVQKKYYMTILRETFYRRFSLKDVHTIEGFFFYQFPVLATQACFFYFIDQNYLLVNKRKSLLEFYFCDGL
jgi:hypothetical protein